MTFQVRELIENALSKRTKIADKKGTYRGWGGGDDGENDEGYVMVGLPAIHEGKPEYIEKRAKKVQKKPEYYSSFFIIRAGKSKEGKSGENP